MMIAVDTNVLVYAHRREVTEHAVAQDCVRALASGRDPWAIPWPCVYEFFSVVTNPKIWRETASYAATGMGAAGSVVRRPDRSAPRRVAGVRQRVVGLRASAACARRRGA